MPSGSNQSVSVDLTGCKAWFSRLFEAMEMRQWRRDQATWEAFLANVADFDDLEFRENELDRRLGQNSFRW
jgi:hypothetical protein